MDASWINRLETVIGNAAGTWRFRVLSIDGAVKEMGEIGHQPCDVRQRIVEQPRLAGLAILRPHLLDDGGVDANIRVGDACPGGRPAG